MRIAFDVSPLSHPRTGVGNYIRGSLAGLVEAAAGQHQIVAFAPTSPRGLRAIPEALEGIPLELRLRFLPFAHFWRQGWSLIAWPPTERLLGGFDVLHFSDWMFPPQRAGLRATTIHDLVPLRFPQWVTPRTRAMHGRKYANAARSAHLFLCNSAFTAREVVELLRIAPERTRVAHPGVHERYRPDGDRADLGRPYLLTVATLEPRKNLETLLRARLPEGHVLAVVGAAGWGPQPQLARPDVIALGFVEDERLPALYRGAAAFC
jgi:glycosyltransferase involved in cell wall biosynthesis